MEYFRLSIWFVLIHTFSYIFAGALALKISKDIYESKDRLMDYVRDMSNPKEKGHVGKWFLPAQLLRGLLMSFILYPIIIPLGELSFGMSFLFFFGLVFIFTHIACAAPCSDNIEGFVYLKERYLNKTMFFKFQFEMIIYSSLFGLLVSLIIF